MINLKFLQKFFFLLFIGFSLCSVLACDEDDENEKIENPTNNNGSNNNGNNNNSDSDEDYEDEDYEDEDEDEDSNRKKCKYCYGTGECKIRPGRTDACNGTGDCTHCSDGWDSSYGYEHKCGVCDGTDECTYCDGTGECSYCDGTGYQ